MPQSKNPLKRRRNPMPLKHSSRYFRREREEGEPFSPMPYSPSSRSLVSSIQALSDPKFHDVTFIVGDEHFPANRTLFAVISDVLKECLFRDTPGSQASDSEGNDKIHLPNVSPGAFRCIYNHAYRRNPGISLRNLVSVRELCDRYQVMDLIRLCDTYFESCITPQNVCFLLKESMAHDVRSYARKCESYISGGNEESHLRMLASDAFKSLPPTAMSRILSSNFLQISEERLFKAVLEWAHIQGGSVVGQERGLLEYVKKWIRFPLMSGEFLVQYVVPRRILSESELVHLLAQKFDPKIECPFNRRKRNPEPSAAISRTQDMSRGTHSLEPNLRIHSTVCTFRNHTPALVQGIQVPTSQKVLAVQLTIPGTHTLELERVSKSVYYVPRRVQIPVGARYEVCIICELQATQRPTPVKRCRLLYHPL